MALPLVQAVGIQPGMRVLEVGAGSGQVAGVLAKHWDVSVVTMEIWGDLNAIQKYAASLQVQNQVLAVNAKAQNLPFADGTFDAVISIGSFEMIGDERLEALNELVRVVRHGGRIGIAEPMCLPVQIPPDIAELDNLDGGSFQKCFRSVEWNFDLFRHCGLKIINRDYFVEARQWWMEYRAQRRIPQSEQDLIYRDEGRWLSLGMVVGEK